MAFLEHDKVTSPKLVENSASLHDADGADQLVYQLVRVEEDGTVVPASEDEVMGMGSFLEGGAAAQASVAEANPLELTGEEATNCDQKNVAVPKEKISVGPQNMDDGLEVERKKILAQLAFLDALLHKLKHEEQERACLESAADKVASHSKFTRSQCVVKQGRFASTVLDGCWDSKSDTNIMSSDISDDFGQKKSAVLPQTLDNNRSKSRELESPSSTSKQNWMSTSNESLFKENFAHVRDSGGDVFKGSVSLDNLSIKDLQQAFQTTFGRPTSVKDKQWLKRRIALGLGGSLEVTSAEDGLDESPAFSLADGNHSLVKCRQIAEDRSLGATLPSSLETESLDHNNGTKKPLCEATSTSFLNQKFFDHRQRSRWMPHLSIPGKSEFSGEKSKSLLREEGKRERKPTKRYIEELAVSDIREANEKVACIKEDKDETHNAKKMYFKVREKQDAKSSLGISKVKVRTGHRKRRGCPNKGGNRGLTSSLSDRAVQLVRKALSLRTSRVSGDPIFFENRGKIKSFPRDLLDEASDSSISPPSHQAEPISNLPELTSPRGDTNILLSAKVRTPKKHHRPWTLREVMNLLEGVTHCGVGKWADIKKHSFSNCVFRSSTDLKDKWRNLVRASNTHYKIGAQSDRFRKHSPSSVPGPILAQVLELTRQRGQSFSINGLSRSGRNVFKKQLT